MKLVGTIIKNTDRLVQRILDGKTVSSTDSYIVFDGELDNSYPFLNATFLLIKSFDKNMYGAKKAINWMQNSPKFRELVSEVEKHIKIDSVRLQYVKSNQTLPLPEDLSTKATRSIIKAGLEVANHNQSHDMWLYLHEETQTAWIGIKISEYGDFHTEDRKGVLRPQIAYMMNYLVGSQSIAKVLDPFAGSGEILRIREKYFDGNEFVSTDIGNKPNSGSKKHKTLKIDFFKTSYVDYFDAIVTDPPWGKQDGKLYLDDFYKRMINKFRIVLKKGGIVVLLISRESSAIVESHLVGFFRIEERFEFKVWGMPVFLYRLTAI